jgi:hypothetical protein
VAGFARCKGSMQPAGVEAECVGEHHVAVVTECDRMTVTEVSDLDPFEL